jgi:nicotinamidase-related amidase
MTWLATPSRSAELGCTQEGKHDKSKFDKEITALLVIDPYNDFISDGGKLWDRLKTVAEANHCVPHMLQVLSAARKAELRVFYALSSLPSRRLRDLEIHCTHPESSVVAKDLRKRHVGRRDPP